MTVKVDYRGRIHTTIPVEVDVEFTANDIYNWIQRCDAPETLRYISRVALSRAKHIERPELYEDDDDFRSRA